MGTTPNEQTPLINNNKVDSIKERTITIERRVKLLTAGKIAYVFLAGIGLGVSCISGFQLLPYMFKYTSDDDSKLNVVSTNMLAGFIEFAISMTLYGLFAALKSSYSNQLDAIKNNIENGIQTNVQNTNSVDDGNNISMRHYLDELKKPKERNCCVRFELE